MPKKNGTDTLLRAISLLTELRTNTKDLGEQGDISESHVNQFHTILSTISLLGIEVIEFHISESEVKPQIASQSWGSGQKHIRYTDESYIRKSIFLTKLDGILDYLDHILKEPERSTGFKQKE